ncbi:phospholipase D-like domain-containing protein [Acinetobacter bereziniae]|uniref:phospholipase D-like domain-containing protein n=1 Tax=Acinetobacter bereziniae TaxID=106648 RepID=UPI003AF9928F
MKLSTLSLSELVQYITDDFGDDRLTGPKIVELFNFFGSNDDYDLLVDQGNFFSRKVYTNRKLVELNNTPHLKPLIESLVDDRRCKNPQIKAEKINKILKHDQYQLEINDDGVYKLKGKDFKEDIQLIPIFENIESQVIEQINSAKYLIWVAVAWITSRPIAAALYKQYKNGVNIRIVVNDDELTNSRGIKFEQSNIEYYKVSPLNDYYKNIMHHKFCIIDLSTVITGSFNWTNKANFNNENINIICQRDQAETYANEFLKLIKDIERK